jgi:hypothetical protein
LLKRCVCLDGFPKALELLFRHWSWWRFSPLVTPIGFNDSNGQG